MNLLLRNWDRIREFVKRITRQTATRLTVSLFTSVLIIVIILTTFAYQYSVSVLEKESAKGSLQTVVQTTKHIDNMLQDYEVFSNLLTHDQEFLNKLLVFTQTDNSNDYESAVTRILNIINSYIGSNSSVSSINIFSADQNRVLSSLRRINIQPIIRSNNANAIKQLDWFQRILHSDRDSIYLDTRKNGFISTDASTPMFAIARTIRSPFDPTIVQGYMVIEIQAKVLKEALEGFRLGTSGGIDIVGEEGEIVYTADELSIEEKYSGAMPTDNNTNKEIGPRYGNFYAKDTYGVVNNYSYQQSTVSGWYVVGYYPKSELLAPMREMLGRILGISLICGVAAAFIVWFLVQKGIGNPLRKLRLLMQEGEKGNLNVRMDFNADTEIGDLGRTFNKMMDQITLAYYDTLTNLPNRRLLVDRMQEALMKAENENQQLAVLFVDIDRFKMVNDSLGHHAGDLLIQLVGQRLLLCTREEDTVARIAGDEFVILLPNVDEQEAINIAERMLEALRSPFIVLEQELFITGSIGISQYPEDASVAETLIKCADMAMYEAKARGKNNLKLYLPEMAERSNERMKIENDLHRALDNEQFELYYQPRVNSKLGTIVGCEALIRWNHDTLGQIPPDRFISVAEETGLIVEIGEWVLREACRQNKAWQDAGYPNMRVAVNVSAKQFDNGLVECVNRILDETGLSGHWLEVEITESVLIDNESTITEALRGLKSSGIHLSIDDFGTGYSSLAYLMKFEVDTLKIDQSFVHDITSNLDNQTIASAVIQLAHNLGMKVVSEGVETQAEYDFLLERGSDEMQGYLISKPVPAAIYEKNILMK